MTQAPVLLWFRRDLRLADQAAVLAAAASGAPVIPVYVLDDETPRHRKLGAASRWWLDGSLRTLSEAFEARGSRLILRRGASPQVLVELAAEVGATAIHALHHYEPWWRNAEKALVKAGLNLHLHHGNFLLPPGTVKTGGGTNFRIYTPFWRASQQLLPPPLPSAAPDRLAVPSAWPDSDRLADWGLLPTKPDWAAGFRAEWTPGEAGAQTRLDAFIPRRASAYDDRRNFPSEEGTSRLSPHLALGEISPAQVWHGVEDCGAGVGQFRAELGWRDYGQNIIAEFPDYGARPAKPAFDAFPWREDAQDLAAWQQGRTGYPIVDAGMRQLWQTGWIHNRVRMIVASFLIKHLLIDWRQGEQWFWDTLVDADYAQNVVNWQWSAGSGVDANQFTRIMAPLTQSPKFDAGDYIRRYVPELSALGEEEIHDPTPITRRRCQYPMPIVGHVEARNRALTAYATIKAG
jgi:deoxyribodipyrimidine photo-lyase